ncbi:hypothetical protein Trydic_g14507 [Trypoxylus dichotomus]
MGKGGIRLVMALRKPNGSYTEGEKERVCVFLETHFPGSKQTDLEETIVNTRTKSEDWEIARRKTPDGVGNNPRERMGFSPCFRRKGWKKYNIS